MRSDDVNIVRPVRKQVCVFLDMTTYEQLKKRAILSKMTIAKMAGQIISSYFEAEENKTSKL
ncbi:hypothetical protein AMR62_23125 [Salmonella enterica]|nr:hypothetical protein [Salmonella enterica]ECX2001771.1 hypothetical protein [Salmonella enterica subsp. enterica serovar Newport]EGX8917358.1 hypothetical protein [Salmonella enterica subsp. enterica serovar Anatum]ELS7269302.1 hypothetical protein [Escherichia coli]RNV73280.1 hypothetical protein CAG40_003390 [Klebsiella pneumoniae]ROG54705.1 hypothetical protein C4Y55_011985 [Klebsiella pneumoniae subsp. pneumoniae]